MRLLIAGAGGHGRVVADLADTVGAPGSGAFATIAFIDDQYPALKTSGDWPIVGRMDDLPALARQFDACVAAFGNAALRLEIQRRALALGLQAPILIHPHASVSRRARLGAGTVVIAGAVVNVGAQLGQCCIVNTAATIDHDCRIDDAVHVCPGANIAGDVTIGARTWFGIGAVAKQGIRVGADVVVGAGSVCIRDIADGAMVAGVPAKEIRK